jgi:predicted acylesterase/phospholipase RssA
MSLALVLSGGGFRGAFQAGALGYLYNETNIRPDIIIGVSAGALNGGPAVLGDIDALEEIWQELRSFNAVYGGLCSGKKGIALGFLTNVLLKRRQSVFDNRGLKKLIEYFYGGAGLDLVRSARTDFYVGVTNLQSGEFSLINKKHPFFLEYVLASATVVGLHPPVDICGTQYLDGGVRCVAPIVQTLEMFPLDRVIFIGCYNPKEAAMPFMGIDPPDKKYRSLLNDIMPRTTSLTYGEIYRRDVKSGKELASYYLIPMHVIEPEVGSLNFGFSDFNKRLLNEAMEYGFKRAKEIIPKDIAERIAKDAQKR